MPPIGARGKHLVIVVISGSCIACGHAAQIAGPHQATRSLGAPGITASLGPAVPSSEM